MVEVILAQRKKRQKSAKNRGFLAFFAHFLPWRPVEALEHVLLTTDCCSIDWLDHAEGPIRKY